MWEGTEEEIEKGEGGRGRGQGEGRGEGGWRRVEEGTFFCKLILLYFISLFLHSFFYYCIKFFT